MAGVEPAFVGAFAYEASINPLRYSGVPNSCFINMVSWLARLFTLINIFFHKTPIKTHEKSGFQRSHCNRNPSLQLVFGEKITLQHSHLLRKEIK